MNKHRAIPTTVDGIKFMSKGEAGRYQELRLLQRAGDITDLLLQPAYVLHVINRKTGDIFVIGRYIADFAYIDVKMGPVVEDFKGQRLPMYKWKKKHVEAEYGIKILETGAKR